MDFSREQLARLSQLLDEALALEPAAQAAWLDGLPPAHADLKDALRRGLAQGQSEAWTLPAVEAVAAENFAAGQLVGAYELIRRLGRGGMAQVWLARRADGSIKRQVALKVPLGLHVRGDLKTRFEREQQILAGLEHPNIARLYDAGVDGTGRPYLAMEYVDGRPITDWCDGRKLPVPERLLIFLQLLDALRYAHERGVVHRDIKPSNILVTEQGQARLLDFGVAKLLEAFPQPLTQVYGQALTPEYASPEQLQGKEALATSDIYALGVVLYELLCGARPVATPGATSKEPGAATKGGSGAPPTGTTGTVSRPSSRLTEPVAKDRATSAARLVRQIKGDLDAIVLKALAEQSTDRYQRVQDLAEDIRRYLHGEATEVRGGSLLYRLAKGLRRSRAVVGAAVASAALLALVWGSYEYLKPAPVAPPIATAVLEKSIAVLPFVDMSEKHDQEYFSDGLAEELLDRLAQLRDLKVISRTSSFSFKGGHNDVRDIGQKLGVAYVLEGSVRRATHTLRVTAQLVRTGDGVHVWSQSFDRDLADLLKLQSEIARAIAVNLNAALVEGLPPQVLDTSNIEALDLYMKARAIDRRNFSAGNYRPEKERALQLLHRAVEIDPKFGAAWATLASSTFDARYDSQDPDSLAAWKFFRLKIEEAHQYAVRAVQVNPHLANAHTAMGRVLVMGYLDVRRGAREIDEALNLDPNSAWAMAMKADIQTYENEIDVARRTMVRAMTLDPLNHFWAFDLAKIEIAAGNLAGARAAYERFPEFAKEHPNARWMLAYIRFLQGEADQALADVHAIPDEDAQKNCPWCVIALDRLQRQGDAEKIVAYLERGGGYGNEVWLAQIHAMRGKADEAFAWLDRAVTRYDSDILYIRTDPLLKMIASDPRFKAIQQRIGLTNVNGSP